MQIKKLGQRNLSIECAKLIASFFVIFIHIPFPGTVGHGINCAARCAVPLFFAVSGYFSYRTPCGKLAKRLGLVGWCCNLPGGEVLAELQGEAARIDFLVGFMHSLKRIRIDTMQIEELAVDEQASQFLITG